MPNPYLVRLREQHDALRTSIEGLQTRAAEGNRDLSEEELRSVTEQATQLRSLTEQIEQLTDVETRSRRVGELAAQLSDDKVEGEQQNRSARYTTQDRDPGHYRSEKEGGERSFFKDHYRATALKDPDAQRRLDEHMRAAVTQASGGTGVIPPKWLTDEYMALARQTRVVADLVRRIPLGRDPRPLTLPKQTAGTDANITTQSAEGANDAGWGTARYTSNNDTLTPVTKAAYQDVSRQLLDAGIPAVDSIIMGDLRGAWDAVVEGLVCAAILAGGTATGTTFANEAAFKANAAAIDAVIDAQTAVAGDQRGPADLAIMNYRRFGAFRKLKDGNNRPLMPVSRYGPQNATGALDNRLVGDIEGVDAVASSGVPTAYAETYAVLRRNAVFLGESDVVDFTYDQVGGPAFVRMGIWGYVGTLIRNPASISIQTVTVA
jgi:HK97 family phage major capsid protein